MSDKRASNEKEFNETLQRMLKTPPSHHEDEKKGNATIKRSKPRKRDSDKSRNKQKP